MSSTNKWLLVRMCPRFVITLPEPIDRALGLESIGTEIYTVPRLARSSGSPETVGVTDGGTVALVVGVDVDSGRIVRLGGLLGLLAGLGGAELRTMLVAIAVATTGDCVEAESNGLTIRSKAIHRQTMTLAIPTNKDRMRQLGIAVCAIGLSRKT